MGRSVTDCGPFAQVFRGRSVARSGCKELPSGQLAQRTEVSSLHGSPRRALSAATAMDLSAWLIFLTLACCPLCPLAPTADRSCPLLCLHRLCDRRRTAGRRLLEYVQPQLAGLPPQRLDLLLLHLGLVLLLTLAHVRTTEVTGCGCERGCKAGAGQVARPGLPGLPRALRLDHADGRQATAARDGGLPRLRAPAVRAVRRRTGVRRRGGRRKPGGGMRPEQDQR